MKRIAGPLAIVMLLQLATCTPGKERVQPARISPTVVAFLENRCVRCHGPKKQKAKLRFDTMPTTVGDEATAQRWQDILDVLNLDQMPPDYAPQPSKKELSDVLEELTANLADARKRLTDSGGHIVLRRLNRREYRETIRALFGVPVDITMLPEDGKIEGFDTLGQAHNFSSLHLERYLKLGRRVLDQIIPTARERKPRDVLSRSEPERRALKDLNKQMPRLEKKIENYTRSIAMGRKQHLARREITKTELDLARKYLARSETKTGVLIPFRGLKPSTWISVGRKVQSGTYRIRVRCGVVHQTPVTNAFLKVVRGEFRSKVPDAVDYYHVKGTIHKPHTIEFTVDIDNIRSNRLTFEKRHFHTQKLKQFASARKYFFKYPQVAYLLEDRQPDLWIDWIEFQGPLPQPAAPLSARKLFAGRNPGEVSDKDARKIIERFAFEAFRHQQPAPEYVDRLLTIFQASRKHGANFPEALKDALMVVLASPRFLFLYEPRASGEDPRPLTERELAVRLSYFLWSAPPDAELYRLAEKSKLRDPKVLAQQVDRMIQSRRSSLFVETFLTQWLELDRLNLIRPDATISRKYDRAVQQSSSKEVFAFFNTLLQEDLPVTHLIDSDFVVINSVLAQYYGLPNVAGDTFRKVQLPRGSVRGGLLGQSAILTLTGTGDRTSPVERGVFVLRKLLDRPPPPAPANVPMLDEKTVGTRSIRETLAIHMTKAQCQSCHRRIDPIGFGMENFDPVGRWRSEVVSTDGKTRFPIQPAGVMPDGKRTFANFRELKQRLAEDRASLVTGLTKALMTYALGRTMGFSDQKRIHRIVKETARNGYGLRKLVHKIVQSKPFLTK